MEDVAALEAAKSMSLGLKPSGIGLPVDFQVRANSQITQLIFNHALSRETMNCLLF